jgi:hypothetical protein
MITYESIQGAFCSSQTGNRRRQVFRPMSQQLNPQCSARYVVMVFLSLSMLMSQAVSQSELHSYPLNSIIILTSHHNICARSILLLRGPSVTSLLGGQALFIMLWLSARKRSPNRGRTEVLCEMIVLSSDIKCIL